MLSQNDFQSLFILSKLLWFQIDWLSALKVNFFVCQFLHLFLFLFLDETLFEGVFSFLKFIAKKPLDFKALKRPENLASFCDTKIHYKLNLQGILFLIKID